MRVAHLGEGEVRVAHLGEGKVSLGSGGPLQEELEA